MQNLQFVVQTFFVFFEKKKKFKSKHKHKQKQGKTNKHKSLPLICASSEYQQTLLLLNPFSVFLFEKIKINKNKK